MEANFESEGKSKIRQENIDAWYFVGQNLPWLVKTGPCTADGAGMKAKSEWLAASNEWHESGFCDISVIIRLTWISQQFQGRNSSIKFC